MVAVIPILRIYFKANLIYGPEELSRSRMLRLGYDCTDMGTDPSVRSRKSEKKGLSNSG